MDEKSDFVVHKFGGTSLANADCFRRVRDIVLAAEESRKGFCVVVSAIGGKPKVTDLLLGAVAMAKDGDKPGFTKLLTSLMERHRTVIHELLPRSRWAALERTIAKDIGNLTHVRLLARRSP